MSELLDRAYQLVRVSGGSHLVHMIAFLNMVREGALEVICHAIKCFEFEVNSPNFVLVNVLRLRLRLRLGRAMTPTPTPKR